jgi:hypothetical protein
VILLQKLAVAALLPALDLEPDDLFHERAVVPEGS